MTDIAIRVDNLSKLYPEPAARAGHLGAVHQRPDTLRDALTGILPRTLAPHARAGVARCKAEENSRQASGSPDDLWALKDVSFEACPAPTGVLRKAQPKDQARRGGGDTCTCVRCKCSFVVTQDRHRLQRRGQIHPAQDPRAHHLADQRPPCLPTTLLPGYNRMQPIGCVRR